MKPRPLCKPTHFSTELGAISYLLHLRWDARTHTHTHVYTRPEKHMFSLKYRIHESMYALRTKSLPPHTHTRTPHVYPITEAPGLSLQAEKPNLFIPVGIIGRGRGWNASNRVQGPPLSKLLNYCSSSAPQHPPVPPPHGTRLQWTWAELTAWTLSGCAHACVCLRDKVTKKEFTMLKFHPPPQSLPPSPVMEFQPQRRSTWSNEVGLNQHPISSHNPPARHLHMHLFKSDKHSSSS